MQKRLYFIVLASCMLMPIRGFERVINHANYFLGAQQAHIAKIYFLEAFFKAPTQSKRKKVARLLSCWTDLSVEERQKIDDALNMQVAKKQ